MHSDNIFNSKNLKTIAVIGISVMILALVFSLFQTPKYESTVKLLTVYNQTDIDTYTASKTSTYVANVLSEVVYSNSFIDSVLKSNFELDNNLGISMEDRLKNWEKMINIGVKDETGILIVDVLHKDRSQADQYAQAITYTLVTKHKLYHGLGDNISMKIIDTPVTSDGWAQPKLLLNAMLGLITGLIVGLTLIVIFPYQNLLNIASNKLRKQNYEKNDTIKVLTNEDNEQTQIPTPEIPNPANDPNAENKQAGLYKW